MSIHLGDNCIQICHLGRYIVGYTVGNFVLWRHVSGAVKHDFRTYMDDIPPQMTNWNMVIPILMYFFNIYKSTVIRLLSDSLNLIDITSEFSKKKSLSQEKVD